MGARRILSDRRVARTRPTCAAARAWPWKNTTRTVSCGPGIVAFTSRPPCNTDSSHGLFSSGHCNGRPTPHLYGCC